MSAQTFEALLREFGGKIGLPELRPDERGYCALSFDDLDAHLQYAGERDELVVFTRLGVLDDEDRAGIYERMLEANLFWGGTNGGTLGVEPDSGMVFLMMKADLCALDGAAFDDLLERFIAAGERWRQEVAAFAGEGETPPTGEEAPASLPDGLIRG